MITLYDYFRSSACFRVRIALNYKGIAYTKQEVHLVNDGGQQHSENYQAVNPQQLVPALVDDGQTITQSLAIINYLEHRYPEPSLFTDDLNVNNKIYAVAYAVACDIHPLNNLRVLQYLKNELKVSEEDKQQWYEHWIHTGFTAIEKMIAATRGAYCFADQITLADVCLVPQVHNAYRFKCDMQAFPHIDEIYANCLKLPAFQLASPDCVNAN